MTRDELDALREGWDFEAKLAVGADGRGALPDSFWETYSAMDNTSGGHVVLGVRERIRRMIANAEYDSRDDKVLPHFGFATLLLQLLLRKGMLKRDCPGRGCTYRLPGTGPGATGAVQADLGFGTATEEAAQTGETSPQTFPPTAAPNSAQSGPGVGPVPAEVARVASTLWARQADIRAAIVAACRGRFLTIQELARLLNRSPRMLQQHYVRHLVADGALALRHPEQSNHPDQAYRTAEAGEEEGTR